MGGSQTKDKSSPSEKVVEILKNKVRVLQGEINEIMSIRESENQVYERELIVFAFKQAEWKRERKRLKEEMKKLRMDFEEKQERWKCTQSVGIVSEKCENEWQMRRDQTVEKWKQLYFAIKVELDELIQRTHRSEKRVCWTTEEEEILMELKKELEGKEEKIKFLQAKLASMEQQEMKRERKMDILRQSLRIMSHNKKATTLAKARGQSTNLD